MDLLLAGIGAALAVFSIFWFPKVGHPAHIWLARFAPALAEKERRHNAAITALKGFVDYNLEAARYGPRALDHHAGPVRLDIAVGAPGDTESWIGGLPEMPDDMAWPEFDGWPAVFMAQIALSNLPAETWGGSGPRRGWLLFFWAPRDFGGPTVLHVKTRGPARAYPGRRGIADILSGDTRSVLESLGRAPQDFVPVRWPLEMSPGEAPMQSLFVKMQVSPSPRDALQGADPSAEPFRSFLDGTAGNVTSQAVEFLAREQYGADPKGVPVDVRAVFEPIWRFDAEYGVLQMGGSLPAGYTYTAPKEPVLLLQLPPSHLLGWMIGDVATLGFFIAPEDLAAGRFDRAWSDIIS